MYRGHAGLSLLLFSPFMFLFRSMGSNMTLIVLSCFLTVIVSFVPDMDIIVEITYGRTEHRGITHTFLFGLVVGVLFSVVLSLGFGFLGLLNGFVAGFGGTASHILGDIVTQGPPKVKPFHPFSDTELAWGFFKASNKTANNLMCVLGIIAFVASYTILTSTNLVHPI